MLMNLSVPKTPVPIPIAECYQDSDCTYDKSCKNEICINPCIEDHPCAVGSFCSVNRHQPVCACPSGYIGDPKIECIPRKFTRRNKNLKNKKYLKIVSEFL